MAYFCIGSGNENDREPAIFFNSSKNTSDGKKGVIDIVADNEKYGRHILSVDPHINALTWNGDIIMQSTKQIKLNVDNGYMRVQGGSDESKGGRIVLSGKDRTGNQGNVEFVAEDGVNRSSITLTPNGTTTCPTPPANDNSSRIATTQWVNGNSVKKSGDTMSGSLTSNTNVSDAIVARANTLYNQNPSATIFKNYMFTDQNGQQVAKTQFAKRSNGKQDIGLVCLKPGSTTSLVALNVGYDENGNAFCETTITPATTDNSNKIATTAYVKSNIAPGSNVVTGTFTTNTDRYTRASGSNNYYIENGNIVFVSFNITCTSPVTSFDSLTGVFVPKPKDWYVFVPLAESGGSSTMWVGIRSSDGQIYCRGGLANKEYIGSAMYFKA